MCAIYSGFHLCVCARDLIGIRSPSLPPSLPPSLSFSLWGGPHVLVAERVVGRRLAATAVRRRRDALVDHLRPTVGDPAAKKQPSFFNGL